MLQVEQELATMQREHFQVVKQDEEYMYQSEALWTLLDVILV